MNSTGSAWLTWMPPTRADAGAETELDHVFPLLQGHGLVGDLRPLDRHRAAVDLGLPVRMPDVAVEQPGLPGDRRLQAEMVRVEFEHLTGSVETLVPGKRG